MIETIAKILVYPLVAVLSLAGYTVQPQSPNLGIALPQAVAVFETSLASPITSSATTMTLTANSVRGGGSLSGYNCFTIDEGSSQAETVCGTVSGTSVSSMQRGISQANGTTTVAALQFSHRRGANVKITDFPVIQLLKAQNNGEETFENAIRYATSVSTSTLATNDQNLASVAYANSLSFGAVAGASESAAGFVELATGLEAASSTSAGGTGARLSIPASLATSTAPSSGHVIPVTGISDGNIAEGFLPTTLSQNYTFSATTTLAASTTFIGSTNVLDVGKNVQVFTASSTFNVPTGVSKVKVRVYGAGSGSSGTSDTDSTSGADQNTAHGRNGNYAEATINTTTGDSLVVTIGAGGTGTNGYSYSGGNAGGNTTVIHSSGAGTFTATVYPGQNATTYGSSAAVSGTSLVSSSTINIIGGGNAGGIMPQPNNSSAQIGGTGQSAVVIFEY